MIHHSKQADECREAGLMTCWCLHGAVGMASDFRDLAKRLASAMTGSRAVDLWRFLECQSLPLAQFGPALNADAGGVPSRGGGKGLLGYSMGGRLALHALLEKDHPWQAAVIISAHPGLENPADREVRRAADAGWATKALAGNWQDFLTEWNAQPVLGTTLPRDAQESGRLIMRRREVARSFIDWSLGAQEPLWGRLAGITTPVLWVVGEHDAKFRMLAERATAELPHARLAIAPDCGHRVPWEAGEWLAGEVARFFRTGI